MTDHDEVLRLREILEEVASRGGTTTYRELGTSLGLEPPGIIRRVAALLERTMEQDAARERPFVAAVVVSQSETMPRRGFFEHAAILGRFRGDPEGAAAREFFEAELRAAWGCWGGGDRGGPRGAPSS